MGDLRQLSRFPRLTSLSLTHTGIAGNVADLTNLSSLAHLNLGSKSISGNLSTFRMFRALQTVCLSASGKRIVGSLSSFGNFVCALHRLA